MGDVATLSEPDWIVGPFPAPCYVIIEGRKIPNMTVRREGNMVSLVLDDRLVLTVPEEWAYRVAHFAANAMAIGAGYDNFGGETRDRPFAARCEAINNQE